MSDVLTRDESLYPGDVLRSAGGQYELIMQTDGNLVVYDLRNGRSPMWASDTAGASSTRAVMQGDGNFVVYTGDQAIWASETDGHEGAYVRLQDDGNLVVYWQQPLWAIR